MNKKYLVIAIIVLVIGCFTGCSKYKYNEECWWDYKTPTMKLTNQDGEDVYICKSCASECMDCGGKAKEIRFNYFGGPLPLCKDCLKS